MSIKRHERLPPSKQSRSIIIITITCTFHSSESFTMKFTAAVSLLLCTEAVLGARWTQKRRESREARQLAKRTGGTRSSRPMIQSDYEGAGNDSFVSYSTNWAGAVLVSTGFTSVTGTVVVPTLSSSSSKSTTAGSAVRNLSR